MHEAGAVVTHRLFSHSSQRRRDLFYLLISFWTTGKYWGHYRFCALSSSNSSPKCHRIRDQSPNSQSPHNNTKDGQGHQSPITRKIDGRTARECRWRWGSWRTRITRWRSQPAQVGPLIDTINRGTQTVGKIRNNWIRTTLLVQHYPQIVS